MVEDQEPGLFAGGGARRSVRKVEQVAAVEAWRDASCRRRTMKPYRGPPMTLASAAAAHLLLIVWCRHCRNQVEPDPADMARDTVPRRPCRVVAIGCDARSVAAVTSSVTNHNPRWR
jgi:hypothetical protein